MELLIYGPQGTGKPLIGKQLGDALGLRCYAFYDIEDTADTLFKDGIHDCIITTNLLPERFAGMDRIHVELAAKLVKAITAQNPIDEDAEDAIYDEPWSMQLIEWAIDLDRDFTIPEMLRDALGIPVADQTRAMVIRAGCCLAAAGFTHRRVCINGATRVRVYSRKNSGDTE